MPCERKRPYKPWRAADRVHMMVISDVCFPPQFVPEACERLLRAALAGSFPRHVCLPHDGVQHRRIRSVMHPRTACTPSFIYQMYS